MMHPHGNAGDAANEGDDVFDSPQAYDSAEDEFDSDAFDEDESYDEADAAYETEELETSDDYDESMGDDFEAGHADFLNEFDAGNHDLLDATDSHDDATGMTPAQLNSAWSAFEAELADSLDVDGTDEFLGSMLGGFSRVAGNLARSLGPAALAASRLGGHARSASRHAGHANRLARAGSVLAQRLGHQGIAQHLQRFGQMSRGAGRVAGGVGSAAGVPGHLRTAAGVAGSAAAHDSPFSELLAQIGQLTANGADDFEAFDAMADLYEEGVDAALPAAVGMAARLAARALGGQNLAQLPPNARRGFVRAIGAAARHLIQGVGPSGVRALPRLAASSAQAARAQRTPPRQIPQRVGRTITRAARAVARRPRAAQRLSRPIAPARASRPAGVGRGVPTVTRGSARRYVLHGPVELTIRPL